MTDISQDLKELLSAIETSDPETRHEHYAAFSRCLHDMEAQGMPIPAQMRDLAEDLLAEATEASFDNLPV